MYALIYLHAWIGSMYFFKGAFFHLFRFNVLHMSFQMCKSELLHFFNFVSFLYFIHID